MTNAQLRVSLGKRMRSLYVSATLLGFEPQALAVDPALGVSFELEFNDEAHGAPIQREIPEQGGLQLTVLSLDAAIFYGVSDQNLQKGFLSIGSVVPPFGISKVVEGQHYAQATAVFPLSHQLVARIEELRSGGDAQFRVLMRVAGILEHPNWDGRVIPVVLDRLAIQPSKRNPISTLTIPKSDWAEKMLPPLQFGKWRVYELPTTDAPPMRGVDDYIAEAFSQFNVGNYKRAIGASRDAVEAMKEHLGNVINPAFGDSRASAEEKSKFAVEAFSKLVTSMLEFDATLTSMMAVGAHPRPPELSVARADAELAISVAVSWRRYVALRLSSRPQA